MSISTWNHQRIYITYTVSSQWRLSDTASMITDNSIVPMMTSSNGNIFRVTGPLCGEFTGPGEFPTQRPVTRSFDVFFICAWINDWVKNREAGDFRRHRGNYDVNVMFNLTIKQHQRTLLLALCEGKPPVADRVLSQRASNRELWGCRWSETPLRSLWRHDISYYIHKFILHNLTI